MIIYGDSFICDAKVITQFLGGNTQALYSIAFLRFLSLPKNIWVFPGHYDLFQLSRVKMPE